MSIRKHDRTYDLVVFGASGYTGAYVAEHVTTHLPSNLTWALAGRSRDKLEQVAAELKQLNPDRAPPAIETCSASDADLDQLAKKTRVLISTVGPYGLYGEPAFRACAQNGTHYLDVTGEVPFVARMISKYEATAKATGAIMFPQCGIESAPPDLATWAVAKLIRTQLKAHTGDVTVVMRIKAAPSGGTLASVFNAFEMFSLRELRSAYAPYALSPVPKAHPRRGTASLLSHITGCTQHPFFGKLTSSLASSTDAALIERTWGLLASVPSRKGEFYGPGFSFVEYARARSRTQAFIVHWSMTLGAALLFLLPPLRWLAKRYVYKPGEGPSKEATKKQKIEYRTLAKPDFGFGPAATKTRQQALCVTSYDGGLYPLTGILAAEGASTLLEEDLQLEGGIYTPACLGQPMIDRLEKAGLRFEAKLIDL